MTSKDVSMLCTIDHVHSAFPMHFSALHTLIATAKPLTVEFVLLATCIE